MALLILAVIGLVFCLLIGLITLEQMKGLNEGFCGVFWSKFE
jgi:hypothetical protein